MRSSTLISGASLLAVTLASPLGGSLGCPVMLQVLDHVRLNVAADDFCSSYLKLPSAPATLTSIVMSTSTVYTGTTSTSVIFKAGNPPSTTVAATATTATSAPAAKRDLERRIASSDVSQACSCLNLPTAVAKVALVTKVKTVTTTPATHTTTQYPCADIFPTLTPTLPYGDASNGAGFSTVNTLYYLSTDPAGASAQACCNKCFFGMENCVNAFWYFYEGCVVQQATAAAGNGIGNSTQCPSGQLVGLTYTNDTAPAFRSTGNIAGPCGVSYSNLN